jgi:hypothetical protein
VTTGKDSFRSTVERRSAAAVVFLHRLPRWTLLATVFALLAVGMAGTGWVGAAGLLTLAVLLGWFAYLSWPALPASGRLLRVLTLVTLVTFAGIQLRGRN